MREQFYNIVLFTILQSEINEVLDNSIKEVITDATGDVTFTDIDTKSKVEIEQQNVILKSDKYPDVVFYANYFNDSTDSIIYRFSSGIILDSSTETSQYKIVFASYNVNTAKVTFVEKVLA